MKCNHCNVKNGLFGSIDNKMYCEDCLIKISKFHQGVK
jgi:hypothetical protein